MKIIADVGGTRGRWVLVDKKIIKTVKTAGFNPYSYKSSSLEKIIISLKSSFSKYKIDEIIYYGAGINNKETSDLVEGLLRNYFKNTQIDVSSDLLGSCRALCKNEKGIVSILGTGSNSCYYDGNEINMQINSLGYLLGDEGSGYALGRSFLKKFLRNELNDKTSKNFEDNYQIRKNNYKVLYEKSSNKLISSLAEFINENKDDKILNKLISDHFKYYFDEIICKYNSKNLYLSGSIAYFFQNEIKNVSQLYNINVVKIIKDPINHLVDFHVI